jgi:transglutaminase-like putative cysteine protease
MQIQIQHTTRYVFDADVSYSIQRLCLTPPEFDGQTVTSWSLSFPDAGELIQFRDGFGNEVHLAVLTQSHREIRIDVGGIVETEERHGIVTGLYEPAPARVYLRHTAQTLPGPEIKALAEATSGDGIIERLHDLATTIRDRIDYVAGVTDAHTSAAEALADGKGVCQDHAHVFVASCRHLGIPARYVTGYLATIPESGDQSHHAWGEAWVEGLGWIGFDVANRLCPDERYVRLACGLDAGYAAPVRGSRRGGGVEALDVNVVVQQRNAQQ